MAKWISPRWKHRLVGHAASSSCTKGRDQKYPRAETPTHYISMGFHQELYEATRIAVREMIDFLVSRKST